MTTSQPIRAYFGDQALSAGFMAVPHLLRRHYRELGLEEETLVFVLQLLAMTWDKSSPPRSLRDIATIMGKTIKSVRRYSNVVNQLGLVVIREQFRNGQQIGNDYDLTPLWERLAEFAPLSADGDAIEIGRTILPQQSLKAEHLFKGGTEMSAFQDHGRRSRPPKNDPAARTEMPSLGRTELTPFSKNQEDQQTEEDAVVLFCELVSEEDAEMLVATYPACVAQAEALLRQARKGRNPAGLLIHLIERGWSEPSASNTPADPPRPDAIQVCPVCGGGLDRCGGIHGFFGVEDQS